MRDKEWLKEQLANVTSVDGKTNHYDAPDPISAIMFLIAYVDTPVSVSRENAKSRPRAIYRGQSNSSWNLIPSALRLPKNQYEKALNSSEIFSKVANEEFKILLNSDTIVKWPPATVQSGIAAAQHHHHQETSPLPTHLLDWTSLPSVAMDFATRGFLTKSGDNSKATIWWLELSKLESINTVLDIPLPYLTRLYRQRGLFIRLEDLEQCNQLAKVVNRLDFNVTGYLPMREYGDNANSSPLDILCTDIWLDELSLWTRKEGAGLNVKTNSSTSLYLAFCNHLSSRGLSQFLPSVMLENDGGLSTAFGEDGRIIGILRYLAAIGVRRNSHNQFELDSEVRHILNRSVPGIVNWFEENSRIYPELLTQPVEWIDRNMSSKMKYFLGLK